MSPALESHLAKYRSLMPSIALLLHLADGDDGDTIRLIQAERAIGWSAYLESHARRAYSCVASPTNRIAATLAEKIESRVLGSQFSVRDVYLKGWSGLDTPDLVRTALGVLEDAGWVRKIEPQRGEKGGRPGEAYSVNPKVFRK
jgi:putative DNA primase/helicase